MYCYFLVEMLTYNQPALSRLRCVYIPPRNCSTHYFTENRERKRRVKANLIIPSDDYKTNQPMATSFITIYKYLTLNSCIYRVIVFLVNPTPSKS